MTRYYTIDATCEGRCPETDLPVFRCQVRIRFAFYPGSGDGWNEPREDASVEYTAVIRPAQVTKDIETWAEAWFKLHHDEAFEIVADDAARAADYRAECRADTGR